MIAEAYSTYKESGVEWLGKVPNHWQVLPTKRFFGLVAEPAPDENDHELLSIYTDIGVRPRKDLEARGNRASTTDGYWMVKKGDLIVNKLLAWMGAIGMSEYDGVTSPAYDILRQTKPLDPKFYHYLFRCGICFTEFRKYSRGIMDMRLRLYFDQLGQLPMPYPPLDEQKAISSFLDSETAKIDGLVSEQRRLIELLKEKRQAVISHAVTKGLTPNAPMKDSGIEWLGEVPEYWDVVKLKRVAFVRTGVAKGKDHGDKKTIRVPYLRVANVQDGYLDLNEVTEIDILEHELDRYRLQSGDVLMNEGGDFDKLGRGHIWEGQIDPCITQNHVFAVRPTGVSSQWLNRITSSDYAQFYFMGQSKQSTNLASISSTNLMNLPVILPPDEEQSEIIDFITDSIDRYNALLAEAEQAIGLLQERRTTLISAAVTGRIDVREFASKEAVV